MGKHLDAEIDVPAGLESATRRTPSVQSPEIKLASESVAYLRLRNLLMHEYPEINNYLTGRSAESRHLSIETLEKYKVGTGYESFLDENGEFVSLPCVYFPMYALKKDKAVKSVKGKAREQPEETIEEPKQVDLKESGLDSG